MKFRSVALAVVMVVGMCAFSARAQNSGEGAAEAPPTKPLGTVVHGDTTIEFQAAKPNSSEMDMLAAWSAFAKDHRDIARDLGNKPALIGDDDYLKKHADLESFFSNHPQVRDAMKDNPGNFVVGRGTAHPQ